MIRNEDTDSSDLEFDQNQTSDSDDFDEPDIPNTRPNQVQSPQSVRESRDPVLRESAPEFNRDVSPPAPNNQASADDSEKEDASGMKRSQKSRSLRGVTKPMLPSKSDPKVRESENGY